MTNPTLIIPNPIYLSRDTDKGTLSAQTYAFTLSRLSHFTHAARSGFCMAVVPRSPAADAFLTNSSIYALRFFFATIDSPAESIISLRFAAELTSIFSIFFCSLKRRDSSMRSTISTVLTTFCGRS